MSKSSARNKAPAPVAKKPTEPKAAAKPTHILAGEHDPSFLAEIDAAVQQEKLLGFWRTWRLQLIAAGVVVVAGLVGWQAYTSYQDHQAAGMAEAITRATKAHDMAKLKGLLPQATLGNKAIVAFTLAKAENDPLEADRLYAQVYNDRGEPGWLRDIARLQAAMTLMGKQNTLAQEHLAQLVQEGTAPAVLPLALELSAVMAQNTGDNATARQYTERLLAIPQLTPDLRQRAQRRLAALASAS